MQAVVNIKMQSAAGSTKPTTTIAKIQAVDNVQWAHLAFGEVDAIALLEADTLDDIGDAVLKISKVAGVASTVTHPMLNA